jgi:hypothetical protein
MNWFLRKLIARGRSAAGARLQPRIRLALESLEDRCVPTVSYFGGALLTNVEAQAIYYGNGWNSTATSGQEAALDGFLSYIVNSPFTQALTQAGYGVGSGTASAGVVDPASLSAGATLQDAQIQAAIQSLVSSGTVAAPDANRLYVVYVQPNVIVAQGGLTSQQGLLGYHGAFAGHTAAGQAVDIHYAVIAYPGGSVGNQSNTSIAIDDLTSVTSHEVAEAITDPNVNYKTLGWYDPARGEIGDITEQFLTRLNGYLVQEVAGKNDQPLSLTTVTPQPTPTPTPQPVSLTPTQSILSISGGQIRAGQQVTVTIQVAATSGATIPTGVVTLMDGNRVLGNVNLGASGQVVVTLSTNSNSVGSHTITAVYQGTSSFQRSVSNSVTLNVLPPVFNPFPPWMWWIYQHGRAR